VIAKKLLFLLQDLNDIFINAMGSGN